MDRPRRPTHFWRWLMLLAALGGVGVALSHLYASRAEKASASQAEVDKYFKLQKGTFNITLRLKGSLEAIKRHDITCDAENRFELRIIGVVPDKAVVRKGETIVEFAQESFITERDKLLIDLDDGQKNLLLEEQNLEMRKSANLDNIKSATSTLNKARDDLKKYEDLEAPKERRDLQRAIDDAIAVVEQKRADLSTAQDELRGAEFEDAAKRATLETAVKKAEDEVEKAERNLEEANHKSRLFKQYDHPQQLRRLRDAVDQAGFNLERVITESRGNIIQVQSRINNHTIRIRNTEASLEKISRDLEKLVITAPVDGMIAFGNPNRRQWDTPKDIAIGTVVRSREILGSIPDLSKLLVTADLPEEYRSRVKEGLEAKLQSTAIQDLRMGGKIFEISPMANNVSPWDKNSPKVYPIKISTDSTDDRLMPGMSMDIELIIKAVEDVLYVPVEALYNRLGTTYCRVRTMTGAEERAVKTGRASISYVEITDGLREGEEVLLFRRNAELERTGG
ncbi:MAG: HlyD family efflux transporter periplasmic adaptor subunit [Planctomycetota bacterium]